MGKVLLGTTGSVAAIKTPEIFTALRRAGHEVRVVATEPSLYFFDLKALPPGAVYRDSDEWPRRGQGLWQRDDPVLHIEMRRWADLLLVAPLDANTLAKLACGLCDNCLTCVWRAWDLNRPAVLAPAMNTLMWEHPATRRHLRQLALDGGAPPPPEAAGLDDLVTWINDNCAHLRVVAPQSKRLACGDVGIGGLAEIADLISVVNRFLPAQPLR